MEEIEFVRGFLLRSTGKKLVIPLQMDGEIIFISVPATHWNCVSVIGTVPSLVLTTEEPSVLYLSMMSHGVLHLRTLPGG